MNEIKSMVKFDAHKSIEEEQMVYILKEIAMRKGFVWPSHSAIDSDKIRPYQLFRYLIETHPEVQEIKDEIAHELYVDECYEKANELERQALLEG